MTGIQYLLVDIMLLYFPSFPHSLYVLQISSASRNCELINTTLLKAMKITVGDETVKPSVVIYENQTNNFFQAYLGILGLSGRTLIISK